MRAISQTTFGDPEVLQITETDRPSLLSTEVLVEVRASGVNPVDAAVRAGRYPVLGEPPFILGWDVSGIVVEAGTDVTRFSVGDAVFGMPRFPGQAGAYADLLSAPADELALKPTSIDHVSAAALPVVALTAWQALVSSADVQPGQRVLIHGGGGGVGHVAIQIAKARGAEVVTTASEGKHSLVRELGADQVVDYRAVDFAAVVTDVDVVFDTVGGGLGERSIAVLRPGGLLVTAVDHRSTTLPATTEAAGRRFAGVSVEPDGDALDQLAALVDAGRLRPHVERTFALDEVAKAHHALSSSPAGKIVLTP